MRELRCALSLVLILSAILFFLIQLAISVIAALSAIRIFLSWTSGLSAVLALNGKANINRKLLSWTWELSAAFEQNGKANSNIHDKA